MKQWSWDDDELEPNYASAGLAVLEREEALVGAEAMRFQVY